MADLKTPKGRLTPAGVARIKKLKAEGSTYLAIALELNVSIQTVYNALKRKEVKDG